MNDGNKELFVTTPGISSQSVDQIENVAEPLQVNLENVEDMSNVCRTCATITEFVVPIFENEGLQNNLAEKIHKHLPIKVLEKDDLPTVLCYQCASTLLAWHELVECCVQAQVALTTRLSVLHERQTKPPSSTLHTLQEIDISTSSPVENIGVTEDKQKEKLQPYWISFETYRLTRENLQNPIELRKLISQAETKLCESSSSRILNYYNTEEPESSDINETIETDIKISILNSLKLENESRDIGNIIAHPNEGFYTYKHLYAHDMVSPDNVEYMEPGTETPDILIENVKGEESDLLMDDDDEKPLSKIAAKKTVNDVFYTFYQALVDFRNHYASDHKYKVEKCNYPDFTDSEASVESDQDVQIYNSDKFDDLSDQNMRKDKLDDETRKELRRVQTKINGRVYYKCPQCGKTLRSTHTYVYHKRIHTGERPCVCHVCGAQFRTPGGLARHLTETHARSGRRSCITCNQTFANTQNLRQHARIHTGERPYVCSQCGKRFTQSGSLSSHMRTHSDHYPHRCAECGAQFRLRAGLTRHRLKHSGERPHACTLCGKTYRQRHELNVHTLSHTGARPHSCSLCGAAFRQRRALAQHHRKMHESVPRRHVQAIPSTIQY